MANKIKFNSAGFKQLMNSAGVRGDLERRGQAIADKADQAGDHVVFSEEGPQRARVAVVTADVQAMVAERTSLNLTRSVDAGR